MVPHEHCIDPYVRCSPGVFDGQATLWLRQGGSRVDETHHDAMTTSTVTVCAGLS